MKIQSRQVKETEPKTADEFFPDMVQIIFYQFCTIFQLKKSRLFKILKRKLIEHVSCRSKNNSVTFTFSLSRDLREFARWRAFERPNNNCTAEESERLSKAKFGATDQITDTAQLCGIPGGADFKSASPRRVEK